MCPFVELSGKQFQTFNVHQLLHLAEVVRDLGPLWSNSCFPFEDYNGDLWESFHGTKNVDGQIVTAVSGIQKLPEIARSPKISTEVMAFYEHLTSKRCNARWVILCWLCKLKKPFIILWKQVTKKFLLMHKSYCFKRAAKILKILHLVKHPICCFALYAFGNEWICVFVLNCYGQHFYLW